MIEWLLKYPPAWYAEGQLAIAWSWPVFVVVALLAGALAWWLSGYGGIDRGALLALPRLALVLLLVLALARPSLEVTVPEPVRGHVAVLMDDSLSMRLADAGGRSPAARLAALTAPQAALGEAHSRRFDTRYFRFGEGVQPVPADPALAHGDARSELGSALLRVADGHDAEMLAAVVLASDGGGPQSADERKRLRQALLTLRAAGVPVHVLDLAGEAPADVELRALRLPRQVLAGDAFEAEVEIVQRGLAGRSVSLVLEDDGLILDRHELRLAGDDTPVVVRRRLSFAEAGPRLISARVELERPDAVGENDAIDRSLDVVEGPVRVLHFEGEPRFETKFVRRAVADDLAIELTSLVRTAENKYYRLGVRDPGELADGFPATAEALFGYHVLILGSVEAELLSPDQQQAILDFVARRGGGLLLLGGRHAFAEGDYGGRPLARLMPVELERRANAFSARVQARLGPAGRIDPVLDFGPGQAREAVLQRLPPLTVVNPLRRLKPGASLLLQGEDALGQPLVLLASQRYGRGRVVSFAVRDTWRWQMHARVPLEDASHETLWRQMLRELGRAAGGRVRLDPMPSATTPGSPVTVRAQALDPAYRPLTRAEVRLSVTTPAGEILRQRMSPSAAGDGRFEGRFEARESGRHELQVELLENGTVAGGETRLVDVDRVGAEFRARGEGDDLLARIAGQTGGHRLQADEAGGLVALIDSARSDRGRLQRLPLWDAPLLLLALMALAGAEWALRRRRRLA